MNSIIVTTMDRVEYGILLRVRPNIEKTFRDIGYRNASKFGI